jgi:hypothetical protein
MPPTAAPARTTPAGTPSSSPAPAALDRSVVQMLTDSGLISADQAGQLTALGETAQPDLRLLADHLTAEVERLIGPEDGDDGEPAAIPDEALAASGAAVEGIEAVRAELSRRAADRSAILSRVRGEAPTSSTPPAAAPAPPGVRVGRVSARGGQSRSGGGQLATTSLTAGGRPIRPEDLSGELAEALRQATGPTGLTGKRVVAHEQATFPDVRTLGRDAGVNAARIGGVTGPEALVASGGICGPSAPLYAIEQLATDRRPVRDTALAHFGADRGGVVTFSPIELADLASGVGVWTNAMDIDASDGTPTKATVVLNCPTETETLVQAITASVTFGNFRARFFAEQIDASMKVLAAAHARLAEQTLLTTMAAGSVAVTTAKALGASRDVLETLDRAIASMRARQRMSEEQRLRLVAPSWLRNMIRADVARELPGAPTERLAMADTELATWLRVRGVEATWSLDMDVSWANTQAAGALLAWPTTTRALLYPEAAWLFLNGGSLDLGVIRDSTLTSTNDAQSFMETFEGCVLTGPESLVITMTIAPTGDTSGTVDLVGP